jgi:hypothetical protein
MDRHLAYLGVTRHREKATLYSGNDDFKNLKALKNCLSKARPKDTTLDCARRRGLECAAKQNEQKAGQQKKGDSKPIDPFQTSAARIHQVRRELRFEYRSEGARGGVAARDEVGREEISRSETLMAEAERAESQDR